MKPARKQLNPRAGASGKVLRAPAAKFQIHPLLASLPVADLVVKRLAGENKKGGQFAEYAEMHQEAAQSWGGFAADIRRRGIIEPLVCVKGSKGELLIIDGRHRFTAGTEAKLKDFPYRIHNGPPAEYILGAVCQRYHWGKGTRAFFALELHPELMENKPGERTDLEPPAAGGRFRTRKELAAAIGVSDDLIDDAAGLHRLMRQHKAMRDKFIHRVFAGQSLPGTARAIELHLAGHTEDEESGGAKRLKPWEFFEDKFKRDRKTWAESSKKWAKMADASPEWRERVHAQLKALAASIPQPIRELLADHWKEQAL